MDNKSLSYKISLFGCVFAAVVVLLGAYTRLVDAGLGCPDWPGCYGFLTVPDSHEEIKIAEQAFPHAPVEAHKAWPEMVHRYFAGTLGLIIALLAFLAFKARQDDSQPLLLPILLLGLVIFQAALGMWTVTMGLLPIVVMGHLLGGFTTLALLLLLFLRLRDGNKPSSASPLRNLALIGLAIVFIQISLGGWTSANYAAIICTDFPTCQGHWLPPLDIAGAFELHDENVQNYLGGFLGNDARVTIHWLHRLGALVTTLFILFLAFRLFSSEHRGFAGWLLLVLVVQVSLGISNVVFSLPLAVAVAHNGVAALLLLTMVTLVHTLGRQRATS
ncbi:MAG: COX15/CtaA family protein [Gammaproteobacteria bacterium]